MADETIGTARVDVVVDTRQFDSAITSAKRSVSDMSTAAQQQYSKLNAAEKRRVDGLIKQANTLGFSKAQQIAYNASLKTSGPLLDEITKRLAQNAKGAKEASETVSKAGIIWGTALGNVIARGLETGARALTSFVKDSIQAATQIERLALLSGAGATEFQLWAAGAERVGIAQDKLADILKDVQDKVGDFLQTGGGELKEFFENIAPRVGLTADAMARMSGPEALGAYVRALQAANLTQSEMVFHLEAIANDSTLLLPLLLDNAKGMKAAGDEAARLGAIMDDEARASAKELREAMVVLDQALDGVKSQLAQGVTPALADMASKLRDEETQRGIRQLAEGLGQVTAQAIQAAGAIGQFLGRYNEFLQNKGFTPGDDLAELEARRDRIVKQLGKALPEFLLGDSLRAELVKIDNEIAAFPFRNVRSSATASPRPSGPPVRPTADTGGGKKGRAKAPPDFAKNAADELQKLVEVEAKARESFNGLAAQLSGPMAEAAYRYAIEQQNLNELAKLGAIDAESLAQAQQNLTAEYERERQAIEDQLNPMRALMAEKEFELSLMGMSNVDRQTAIDLQRLGTDATWEEVEALRARNEQIENAAKATEQMDEFRRSASDALGSFIDGSKSAKEAAGDFFDDLYRRAAQAAADKIIASLFGQQGESGGGFLGALFGSGSWSGGTYNYAGDFGFDRGGYTGDRPRNAPVGFVHGQEYVLNANATRALGRQQLDQINAGRMPSAASAPNFNFTVNGSIDRRSAERVARDAALKQRIAMAGA